MFFSYEVAKSEFQLGSPVSGVISTIKDTSKYQEKQNAVCFA